MGESGVAVWLRSGWSRSLLAALSGALQVLSFPGADASFLAAIALAPLLVAAALEPNWKKRFALGWLAGVVFWAGACYWIQFVLEVHGGMGMVGSWGAFALFCVAKAIHLGVFALLAGTMFSGWWAMPGAAALWVAIERTHGPLGFAWLPLGTAGIDMGLLVRAAPFTGVYGLSFVFVLLSAALAAMLMGRSRKELLWLALLGILYLLPEVRPAPAGDKLALLLQPNIDETQTWTAESVAAFHNRSLRRTAEGALQDPRRRPDLLVWPEVPAPLYYFDDPVLRRRIDGLGRTLGVPLIFGTVAYTERREPLNSAVLVSSSGTLVDRYDKIFLVPFGEFVPPLFGWVSRITQEGGDFVAGTRKVVFPLDGGKAGVIICYESVFPHLVREFAAAGATLLVNISNDGYFGRSAARWQHLKQARMRALENQRWILRSTNDGVTAVIDPAGRLRQSVRPNQETSLRGNFSFVSRQTFYTRHGDWFVWLCALLAAAGWIGSVHRLRGKGRPSRGA